MHEKKLFDKTLYTYHVSGIAYVKFTLNQSSYCSKNTYDSSPNRPQILRLLSS